jgi:hypothetical protein
MSKVSCYLKAKYMDILNIETYVPSFFLLKIILIDVGLK